MKQENESVKNYNLWEGRCRELFEKAEKCKKIEDKATFYVNGSLDVCKEGDGLLK